MKSILKIVKLYLKKYIFQIILMMFIFSIISVSFGQSIKQNLKSGAISYKLNKDNNYQYFDFILDKKEVFWKNHNKNFEKTKKNDDIKILKSDIDELKNNVIFEMLYSNHKVDEQYTYTGYTGSRVIYNTKYIYTLEELTNMADKNLIKNLDKIYDIKNLSEELSSLKYSEKKVEKTEQEIKEKNVELEKLINEFKEKNKIYLKKGDTNPDLLNLISFNLSNKNKDLSVKEYLSGKDIDKFFIIISVVIVLLIFGLEYHTNFGSFIASLPLKKTTIYFSKILTSVILLTISHAILGFINYWTFKTSVVSEIVNFDSSFFAYYKMYFLSIFIILLGAIFSSFCGSVISILCMYLPSLLFVAYPIIVYGFNLRNLNIELRYLDEFLKILIKNENPLYFPIRLFYDTTVDIFYYYVYFLILVLLAILSSLIYKYHSVDNEGKFFTNKIINYICYLISLSSFVTILSLFFIESNINIILSYIISIAILTPLLYGIFNLKIKI